MPRGIYSRHPKKTSAKKQKLPTRIPVTDLEILTDDDPTLGGVVKHIREKYRTMRSNRDRADYLTRLYEALDSIDDDLKDDSEDEG